MKKIILLILAGVMIMSFMVACAPKEEDQGNAVIDADIDAIHEKLKEEFGEDYIPNMPMEEEQLESLVGVDLENIEKYIAETPMISVNVDTFIAIEAKEGKGDLVEESLEEYRAYLVENSMQYPMNIAKVNAAKVVRHGDYLFFLMIGKYDDRDDVTEEEALEFAQDQVKRAEDVINSFFE